MSRMQKQGVTLAVLLLLAILFSSIQTQTSTGQTDSTIHILSNGTIHPVTASIEQIGSTYKATANINTTIVIERNNIVLDGQGFTIQGTGATNNQAAINLTCTGVTVRNWHINNWQVGILGAYDNNKIAGNAFSSNSYDIAVYGNNCEITQNYLCYVRIQGSNIRIYENKFQTRTYGSAFWVSNSTNIIIEANEFIFTDQTTSFVSIDSNSDLQVYHNNFLSELLPERGQAYLFGMAGISDLEPWDNGYPSGGNYWIAFSSKYGNASMIDDSGIWDTTFVINSQGDLVDRYPLYNPYDIHVAALPPPPQSQNSEDRPVPSVPEFPVWVLLITIIFALWSLKGKAMRKPKGTVCA